MTTYSLASKHFLRFVVATFDSRLSFWRTVAAKYNSTDAYKVLLQRFSTGGGGRKEIINFPAALNYPLRSLSSSVTKIRRHHLVTSIMSSSPRPAEAEPTPSDPSEASTRSLSTGSSPRSSSSTETSPRPLPEKVQVDKDIFINMNLDEKRSLYRCGDRFVTLANVLNWKEYFAKEKIKPANVEEKEYEANEKLNSKVSLWEGDITALEIDCIVNAANNSLLGGGGVDGAIHRAAGKKLLNECRQLKGCHDGQAKITGGYKLPAKYIIHTVGPQGEKPEVLRSAYLTSLQLMIENQLRSVAFPCISTGIFGYPQRNAAKVALATAREFLETNSDKVDRIIFTVFLPEDKAIYEELMQKYFPLQ